MARWQQPQVKQGIKDMWKAWRLYRSSARDVTLGAIFGRWRTWTSYYQLYKKHKEKCRTSKKTFILEQMDLAEQAASSHNQRLLYKVVSALAPKSKRGRPQLRDANGQIMTRGEEATCFQQHFTAKFTASDDGIAALQDTECGERSSAINPGVSHDRPHLSPQTLEHHLSHAPLRKAVPPDHPPIALSGASALTSLPRKSAM